MYRHALAQHLQMAQPLDTEMPETMDQVVQSVHWEQEKLRNSRERMENNRIPPVPPPPTSSRSDRNLQTIRSSPSQLGRNECRPMISTSAPPSGDEESRQTSTRGSDHGTRSSRSETLNSSVVGLNITDFFSAEVFKIVLSNPTTAHRFMRFCQTRACGEHMEFLQKVEQYCRLLDEVAQSLASIQATYIVADAPREINISHQLARTLASDIRHSTTTLLPGLEAIFAPAREDIRKLLATDMYPRFVKHQITTQATMALANQREKFQGLGDCFCLTDPNIADNPIVFASDGFVSVTGYSRKDIIPRNCRFLQGDLTDRLSTNRLRTSIDSCEETVELLLNYRKNGDPFWNLLYVSPLFNSQGDVSFFIGGQINCSTTIHSYTDILKVLSFNEEEIEEKSTSRSPSIRSAASGGRPGTQNSGSFFKSWRKYSASYAPGMKKINVRDEPGMEGELVDKLGKLNFVTQVEAFYTAYSKYIVMSWELASRELIVRHYSPGIIDMLSLNTPNGGTVPIFGKDIFKVLLEHSSPSNSVARAVRGTVVGALREERAVSVEVGLLTGLEEKKTRGGWLSGGKEIDGRKRKEEMFVTHWTPLKGENAEVGYVVLSIAPKN